MTDRIRCCIIGCKRTRVNEKAFVEWICGKHWITIPKSYRRVWGRFNRQWRRFGPSRDSSRAPGGAAAERVWARMKRYANEIEVGI